MKQVAIIRDGYSDYCVIKQFITAIFKHHHLVDLTDDNFFELGGLKISDAMAKYVDNADKHSDYTLHSEHANELRKRITIVLQTTFKKLDRDYGIYLSNQDILVVNTDAEKILGKKHNYFNEWAYTLSGVLWLAIEEFYSMRVDGGFNYESLPLILPLILFPSSEILVAACMYDFSKENLRVLKAKPALKQKVYETDSIPKAIQSGKLHEVLSEFVVPDSLKKIYKEIPEARKFIQILSFNSQ
ncbi:hypothetical protein IH992_01085 [Candidatus Poribacteria bacterium]|nr:hypothetical protein [Candidatus Poribacteria bacterium]